MKCPSSEQMAALYDGNLPKKIAEPMRSHVATCRRCAQELKTLHSSLQQLGSAPAPPARLLSLIKETSLAPQPRARRAAKSKKSGARTKRKVVQK